MRYLLLLFFSFLILTQVKSQDQSGEEDSTMIKEFNFPVLPAFAYSPETRYMFGLVGFFVIDNENNKNSKYYRPTAISPFLIFTSRRQILTLIEFDHYFPNGVNWNFEARYFDYPDLYYGIGNDSDVNKSELFTDNFFKFEGKVSKPFNDNLFVGLSYDAQYNQIRDIVAEGMLANDHPNGFDGGFAVGIGPTVTYDDRNSTVYPTKGRLFNAAITTYNSLIGSQFEYTSYMVDYRQYFEFLGPKNIVAFQYKADLSTGNDIPYYKLFTIAGQNRLRGIDHKNLYKDRQSMYCQVEGRQHLFWKIGGVLFAGAGQVFDELSNFNLRNTHLVYGFGGRMKVNDNKKINLRLDVGFTPDGQHAIYFAIKEAF